MINNKYLIKPNEDGNRKDTKLAVGLSDDTIQELLSDGYFLVNEDDFQKLIGNADKPYSIAMDGTLYETPPYAPPLEELKTAKLNEFKISRDNEEAEPIEYNGNLFDYDELSRGRITAAMIALDSTGNTVEWTTADNKNVTVTAADLKGIIVTVAIRSNTLHEKYIDLKEKVMNCTTKEELDFIVW